MNTTTPIPSDDELERITAAVLPNVMARIHTHPRRHALTVSVSVLSAAGIFAAGIAVGGADSAPLVSAAALTVNCYDSNGTLTSTDSFANETTQPAPTGHNSDRLGQVRKDPARDCVGMANDKAENTDLVTAINQLRAAGHKCGTIQSQNGLITTFREENDHTYTALTSSDLQPLPTPCLTVSLTIPFHAAPKSMIVCAQSPMAANVYEQNGNPDSFCQEKGMTPWDG